MASVTDQGEVELRLGKEILHFPLILFFKNKKKLKYLLTFGCARPLLLHEGFP